MNLTSENIAVTVAALNELVSITNETDDQNEENLNIITTVMSVAKDLVRNESFSVNNGVSYINYSYY